MASGGALACDRARAQQVGDVVKAWKSKSAKTCYSGD
jgi:hypothetical protein